MTAVDATVQVVNIGIQSDNTPISPESLIINSIFVIILIIIAVKVSKYM